MKFSDYIWFWSTSWEYMKGSRMRFWLELPKATMRYRKAFIEDKNKAKKYQEETKDI